MATQLFLRNTNTEISRGTNDAAMSGLTQGWRNRSLSTSRGSAATSITAATADGPVNGRDLGTDYEWLSDPLDADITIAGTITFNLRMAESSMSANAGAECRVERIDSQGLVQETVAQSERGVELGTSESAHNWTVDATDTNFLKGDRIRVRVGINDVGTMNGAFTCTFWFDGPTAAASGDSYVTFTENFSFLTTTPSGTIVYPTDTASDVATSAVDREAWTSRGGGVQSDVVNTATGFTDPIQWTDSAGGTVVDWWTRQLEAFTLGGLVHVNARALKSAGSTGAGTRVEIAVCDSDGSGAVVWAAANATLDIGGTSEGPQTIVLAGDDVSVADGQRLRIRFLIDDTPGNTGQATAAMVGSQTCTLFYAGTTEFASGDTHLTFSQMLTEFISQDRPPFNPRPQQRQLLAH